LCNSSYTSWYNFVNNSYLCVLSEAFKPRTWAAYSPCRTISAPVKGPLSHLFSQ
jgi:hypothetical protein